VAKQNRTHKIGQCRIIAGKWRGRKLDVPDVEGLRPTPDRVRETVFNWLQSNIGGARCLDLFAGCGSLSFEAASRGASNVVMVELNAVAAKQLRENCTSLSAIQCGVEKTTAQQFLSTNTEQYDIVFIDPPYQANLWTEIALQLVSSNALSDDAIVYLECPSKADLPELPRHWQLIKEKKAGNIRYCLFQNNVGESA